MASKKLFFILILLMIPLCLNAQVTIAPTNLFIDSNNKFGTYMVINGSNQTQEISIDFFFGYSTTDEDGNRSLVSRDSIASESYSISDYIRAFPQNFTLSPGQRQIVRIRVNAPNDLDDGVYWARLRTKSTPESPPIEIASDNAVAALVGISVEQVTGLYYKKGDVTTGIQIQKIHTDLINPNNLDVLIDLERVGNSPFLGTINVSLVDSKNKIISENSVSTTIFFDGVYKQTLGLEDLPSGDYNINVSFETRRSDISQQDLVQMETVTATTTVTIP